MKVLKKIERLGKKGGRIDLYLQQKKEVFGGLLGTEKFHWEGRILFKGTIDVDKAVEEAFENREEWQKASVFPFQYALRKQKGTIFLKEITEERMESILQALEPNEPEPDTDTRNSRTENEGGDQ